MCINSSSVLVDDVDEMLGGVDEGVGESLQVSSIDIIFVIGCECGRIEDDRRYYRISTDE